MKKTLITIMASVISIVCLAQSENAIKLIKNSNELHSNITCEYKQEKHIVALDKVEPMEGTLYYTSKDKMAMHYTVPATDLFLINGDKLYMAAKKRKNLFNLKSNPTMSQLANLLLNSMSGNVEAIAAETGAEVKYTTEGNYHVFTLTRQKKAVKGYREVVLKYGKKDLMLHWMKLEEFNGNYNTYDLRNHQLHATDAAVYNIPK